MLPLKDNLPVELNVEQPEPIIVPDRLTIDDSKLKRVSISTNHFLFDAAFRVDQAVKEMLCSFKSKYRVFLVTQVDSEGSQ